MDTLGRGGFKFKFLTSIEGEDLDEAVEMECLDGVDLEVTARSMGEVQVRAISRGKG